MAALPAEKSDGGRRLPKGGRECLARLARLRTLYEAKEVKVFRYEPDEGGNPFVFVCLILSKTQRVRFMDRPI
jgi:hypothetical protein